MAFAGLGLSLGEAAHAKGDFTAQARVLGSVGWADESEAAAETEGWASFPAGPLGATLPAVAIATAPSEEDRAAVALAMVLMAELPSAVSTPLSMPQSAISARWQPSDAFRRDYGPGDAATLTSRGDADVAAASGPDNAAAASGGPGDGAQPQLAGADAGQLAATRPDLDLDLTASAGVDVNLELAPVLDLDLSLSPGLDLNLDLSPAVDLRLDQAPVFPSTKLRAGGAAKPASVDASRSGANSRHAGFALDSEQPVPMANPPQKPSAVTSPLEQALSSPVSPTALPARAAPEQSATHERGTASLAAAKHVRPAAALPTIVVASHADRVMFSLEALLANDDPTSGRFGAQTEEVIVSSHAEKALATLAAICSRDDAELAGLLDQTPNIVTAADLATREASAATEPRESARKPAARQEMSPRAARPSALGEGLIAVNERSLDKVRGGFDAGNGLQISFGIERAVYINGSLVTTTSLNVSDLGKVVGGQAAVTSAVAGSSNLTLIQNGAGNTFITGPVSAATLGTVVQNTLNDQKIQSVTSINATVNSLQMVKAQNFEASMRGALIDALRR
jgi:hypothetical protein